MRKSESFQPLPNTPANSLPGTALRALRLFLDLQLLTILQHLRQELPNWEGAVLDVGCGASPWKSLLNPLKTRYTGIDIGDAASTFAYQNEDCLQFDGRNIPFESSVFDAVLCTEVLEHVLDYQTLVSEMHRVLKPGGRIVVTVPWSARWHYIPFDYFRYSPSALRTIFKEFECMEVQPRGNDIAVTANKLLVMFARSLQPRSIASIAVLLVSPFTGLVVLFAILTAHASLALSFGSLDDPLGYTVTARKRLH
jgi:SAM-dependent methyltransferase